MSESMPTPIVDKNGKQTTVHKKTTKLFPDRLSSASLAPQTSAMQTIEFRSIQEAKAAVYAIPEDAPIMGGYLAKHRDIMSPIDEDDFQHEGWEDMALHYARLTLWNAYENRFNANLGLSETTTDSAAQVASFIVDYQSKDYLDVQAAEPAIKEYLGLK